MRRALALALCGFLAASAPAPERVRVLRVVDGDTLETSAGRVRVWGLNTPELHSHCATPFLRRAEERRAEAAAQRTASLVSRGVTLELPPRGRKVDRYGRLLRVVILPDGRSLADVLTAEGLGRFYDGHGRAAAMFCGTAGLR